MSLRNSFSNAATSWTLCSSSKWTSHPRSNSLRSWKRFSYISNPHQQWTLLWGSPDEPVPAVLAFWNSRRGKFQLSVALNQNVDSVLVQQHFWASNIFGLFTKALKSYVLLLEHKRARVRFQRWHTVLFEVLAAELHHAWNLSVNRVEAEFFVMFLLPAAGHFCRHREVQRLQEPRLVIVKVGDAIHRYSALQGKIETVINKHGSPPWKNHYKWAGNWQSACYQTDFSFL